MKKKKRKKKKERKFLSQNPGVLASMDNRPILTGNSQLDRKTDRHTDRRENPLQGECQVGCVLLLTERLR